MILKLMAGRSVSTDLRLQSVVLVTAISRGPSVCLAKL